MPLGRSLGYIPGVGIVEQGAPLRVLAEPVTVEQQGISVTVSKVVADFTRTFISYRVDGIPLAENRVPASVAYRRCTCPMAPTWNKHAAAGVLPF